ncbi:ATP-dependent DNA helicase PIF1 [Coprinopsis cinerea okayama7|uniref:ATP-dependent DNA helicase n=1 Tax=Coprinopsis cinerea (strain Okayama-7 / 130 / ATCC MYA-4618 / FGSC 9003) TaxID=240176 RepID=A8P2N4_COPC7|nr:ATP-dependent DNA helicase PIF1 [Coprinopsis cinerea okayama7\|eukprot:XP_001838369.2 ATP-dependent DNA helicase PIF1 [Coprinopsis cinerea okayama7\
MSLANGLWIGDIPTELLGLSLPERILISLYFPAVYVVKLYPSGKKSTNMDQDKLQSGIKGNVSTYKLDQQQITDMVGLNMPPPPTILSATIAITYVGPNNLPKACLPGTFRVRRAKVEAALRWLKANNPLYAKINISQSRLSQLPHNSVPSEVLQTVRWSTEVERLDAEHGTYVPLHEDDDDEDDDLERLALGDPMVVTGNHHEEEEIETEGEDADPAVIPLQSHGVLDMAGHDIPDDELFHHALNNTAKPDSTRPDVEGEYAIRHGSGFINEYARKDPVTGLRYDGGPDNPNHLLGTFPYLFPFGKGGFETHRPITVSYESHAKWAMQYFDGRFRKDLLFVFQVFGVITKRQVCRAAALQVENLTPGLQQQLRSLKVEDLLQASQEEAQKIPFSNSTVRLLRRQMKAIRSRVTGTDESRKSIRGKVWGTNLIFNTPSLWITINPSDTHDPIAQVLFGESIDLNAFCNTAGPDKEQRARNVASDPFASAQFFHYIIPLVFETLFGIKAGCPPQKIERREGLFGVVQAYIGTVEAQGRGTLHFHMLVWLSNTPPPHKLRELLQEESFRERVRSFIRQNIVSNIEDKTTAEVLAIKLDKEISYSRPIDPRKGPLSADDKKHLRTLARTLQYHKCKDRVCRILKKGKVVCKRRAPFTLAPDAWVSADGQWGSKRFAAFLNAWNPIMLHTLRCNHDVKVITPGPATRNIVWYVTNYASKKQGNSSNSSALLAQRYAYHTKQEMNNPKAFDVNKRMLQRCANVLGRDREFSAPEVVSYLMGWGDCYESHYYVTIRWDLAMKALFNAYPALNDNKSHNDNRAGTNDLIDSVDVQEGESYTVQFHGDHLEARNQVREYAYRGCDLENESFLKVMLDTYDAAFDPDLEANTHASSSTAQPRQRRPRHDRIPYLSAYGNAKRCRIRRAPWHETLPRFSGRWFPRSDEPRNHETYCAAMLMLLKPWRSLRDLKGQQATFKHAFDHWRLSSATTWDLTVIENIQFYYDCADHADAIADEEDNSMTYRAVLEEDIRDDSGYVAPISHSPWESITEEEIEDARFAQLPRREREYVDDALRIATSVGFYGAPLSLPDSVEGLVNHAGLDELEQVEEWEDVLKSVTRQTGILTATDPLEEAVRAAVLNELPLEREPMVSTSNQTTRNEPESLGCIKDEIDGKNPDQLLMIVHGQGGTGKSLLIQSITQTLRDMDAEQFLGKAATSGIAASPIGGTTVHHYFGIGVNPTGRDWAHRASEEIKARRNRNVGKKHLVIIDEMSMLTKKMLALMSEVGQVARGHSSTATTNSTLPFGGLHVVLFGDFHQFPPVATEGNALYCDRPNTDNEKSALGRELFLQFNTVVILREQRRSRDIGWTEILNRLRVGECTDHDIDELKKITLTDSRCDIPNFDSEEWRDAVLVTPRHSVRKAWNQARLERHCSEEGRLRYIVRAHDTDKVLDDIPRQDFRKAIAQLSWKKTGRLEDEIQIAKGMKAMVLTNIATEADIANGTRGVVEDFWLHPEETATPNEDGTVKLHHLPPVIFFRPDQKTTLSFNGVPEGLIPIAPVSTSFKVENNDRESRDIKRTQFAITGAYAFTDYKSQGQTIEKTVVDIAPTPTGKGLSPFNAYVALSRGRGRDSIRLLRPFQEELFTVHPSEELREEMQRLEMLDRITRQRFEQRNSIGTSLDMDVQRNEDSYYKKNWLYNDQLQGV